MTNGEQAYEEAQHATYHLQGENEMAKVTSELNQTMLLKSTQDTSGTGALGLGKSWSPRNCNLDSFKALALAPDWTLSSMLLDEGIGLIVPLSFHQGL